MLDRVNMSTLLCCLISIIVTVFSLQQDYCWREYTGTVPDDAVVGGKDVNDHDVYIGQAYVKDKGLFVAPIYPGVNVVHPTIGGVHNITQYIKILCGPSENFYWIPVTSGSIHLSLIEKHPVIGGHEDGGGQMSIGRVHHEGEIKIGKVNSWSTDHPYFFINDKGNVRLFTNFQILLYRDNPPDGRYKDVETLSR